jgi:hypothetical protein
VLDATLVVPDPDRSELVVTAPGPGARRWAGAPSAQLDVDGTFVIAYRLRDAAAGLAQNIVARWAPGRPATTMCTLDREDFGAHSLERPAIVRLDDGTWRLYVCCASPSWPASKQWWIEVLDADDPSAFGDAVPHEVFRDDEVALKDPVIRRRDDRWFAWICCHPLAERDEEDRMTTALATSDDGLHWSWQGDVLAGRPGAWDSRGARLTAVLPDGSATYDGRASKEENFSERTGIAEPVGGGALRPVGDAPVATVRYLDVVETPGGYRTFYEHPLPDGSHDLRTEAVDR